MKNAFTYLLIAAMATLTVSCKKDSETPKPAPTKTELLTGKDWVISAATISPGLPNPNGGSPITDIYAQFAACDKDDFIRFDTPGAFKEDEGANKCSSSSTQTRTGTWVFGSNETVITIAGNNLSNSGSLTVADLSATTLKATQTEAFGGVNYTVTVTYSKR